MARKFCVEVVRGLHELRDVDRFADVHGFLRHLVAARDHDDEDAVAAQRHELDALEQRLRVRRRNGKADALARFGQHVRRGRQQVVHQRRVAGFLPQPRFNRRDVFGGAARVEQHVDVAAIAEIGRDAARRGMRLPHVAHVFELRQDVAHGGGRQVQSGFVGERRRRDGFARFDVRAYERRQNSAGAVR